MEEYIQIEPNEMYRNQIDYMIVNNCFKNCIKNIKPLRRADLDLDHLLGGCWMKVKFKKMANCKSTKKNNCNIDKVD